MDIHNLDDAVPFTTADGSTIRSLLDATTAPVAHQSLAEATLAAGTATSRHYHRAAEEFYFLLEGSGEMEIDGDRARVGAGDAILIPAGAWHQLTADADCRIRMLCCCSPPYADTDTFFA